MFWSESDFAALHDPSSPSPGCNRSFTAAAVPSAQLNRSPVVTAVSNKYPTDHVTGRFRIPLSLSVLPTETSLMRKLWLNCVPLACLKFILGDRTALETRCGDRLVFVFRHNQTLYPAFSRWGFFWSVVCCCCERRGFPIHDLSEEDGGVDEGRNCWLGFGFCGLIRAV